MPSPIINAVLSGLMETGLPQSNVCGGGEMRSSLTGTSLITFLLPNLAAGATCTFTVTVHVPATAASGTDPNVTSAVTDGFPRGLMTTGAVAVDPFDFTDHPLASRPPPQSHRTVTPPQRTTRHLTPPCQR